MLTEITNGKIAFDDTDAESQQVSQRFYAVDVLPEEEIGRGGGEGGNIFQIGRSFLGVVTAAHDIRCSLCRQLEGFTERHRQEFHFDAGLMGPQPPEIHQPAIGAAFLVSEVKGPITLPHRHGDFLDGTRLVLCGRRGRPCRKT